jgi:hypothetical protein
MMSPVVRVRDRREQREKRRLVFRRPDSFLVLVPRPFFGVRENDGERVPLRGLRRCPLVLARGLVVALPVLGVQRALCGLRCAVDGLAYLVVRRASR